MWVINIIKKKTFICKVLSQWKKKEVKEDRKLEWERKNASVYTLLSLVSFKAF